MSSIRTSDSLVPHEDSKQIVGYLNAVLANESALFTKALNHHWNITSMLQKHEKMSWMLRSHLV
jgi:DNA-binding ferritin-like protein